MRQLIQFIDNLSDQLGRAISWLALVMVLMMALVVVLRYVFNYGSIAMQESVMYINAAIFSLGAAYTLKEKAHVRVDIFYNKLAPNKQAWVDLLGTVLFLMPAMAIIIYFSWDYVAVSWRVREGSAEASGMPFVYILKSSILLLAGLMLIQGLAEALKAWQRIRGEQQH